MDIIDVGIDFSGNLKEKDRDAYALSSVKVVLCRENASTIDVHLLNQEYKKKNGVGLPYQYIVKKDGNVYFGRSRAYENGFELPHFNILRGAIAILIEGLYGDDYSLAQEESIVELCATIVIQDNILVSDITSQNKILTGADVKLSNIIPKIRNRVSQKDIFRTVGDDDSDTAFYKIVSNETLNTVSTLNLYTFVPKEIIMKMNPHIVDYDNIPIGTTVFLPKNKMFDYLTNTFRAMEVNFIHEKIRHEIKEYEEVI